MPITPGSGRVSGHKTIRRPDATPKLPRLRQVPLRPGTTKDIENAMQPGAGLGGGKGIETVDDADVWSLLKNEPYPGPALMKQAVMALFAEGGAFANSSVPNAGKIAEYLRRRFDKLDELELTLVATMRDDKKRTPAELLHLAHSELEGSGDFPSESSAVRNEFPALPPAMANLIGALVDSDVVDPKQIRSLIDRGHPPLDDDEPASFRDSFTALEQLEIEELIAALDRPQKDKPASEASKPTGQPRREIGRGRPPTPPQARKSTKPIGASQRPLPPIPTQRPLSLVASPKPKPTWQADPFYVTFCGLVNEYEQLPDSENKCLFLYREFVEGGIQDLFMNSHHIRSIRLPNLIKKLNKEIIKCLIVDNEYRRAERHDHEGPKRLQERWQRLLGRRIKLTNCFEEIIRKLYAPLRKSL